MNLCFILSCLPGPPCCRTPASTIYTMLWHCIAGPALLPISVPASSPSPPPLPPHFQRDSHSNLEKHLAANSSPWLETLYLVLLWFFVLFCFSFCLFCNQRQSKVITMDCQPSIAFPTRNLDRQAYSRRSELVLSADNTSQTWRKSIPAQGKERRQK